MSTKMYRMIVLVSLLFCVEVTASKQDKVNQDLKVLMHGVWAEVYTEEGEILSYMSYLSEGRFHAFGYYEEGARNYWFSDGLWKMNGDQSCIVFKYDSFNVMEKNEISCVTIISVTNDTLIYRDDDDGSIHSLKRVSTGFLR